MICKTTFQDVPTIYDIAAIKKTAQYNKKINSHVFPPLDTVSIFLLLLKT